MREVVEIISNSIVNHKTAHVVSAATISAGTVGKIAEPATISPWDMFIGMTGDIAIIAGLVFTLFLFYREYQKSKLEAVNLQIAKIRLAKEERREPTYHP